jgi:hypothetical protein
MYNPTSGILNYALNNLFAFLGLPWTAPDWLQSRTWAMPAIIVMSVWKGLGYNMVLYLAGLQGIPRHLYEAAEIDGASDWQQFRLITYQLKQRGPTFPRSLDMSIDPASGRVTTRYTDDGREKTGAETLELPADLANGMVSTLLKNVKPEAPPASLSYVASTPDPRLVRLEIHVAGVENFATGGTARKATHFVLKVKIGGFAGLVAPLVGKDPPDVHVWILGGDAPAFVRAEQPLYTGGPVWRIELTSPVWK